LNVKLSDNFEFTLDVNDTIFTLTCNNSNYKEKEGINNVISKMFIINEGRVINLERLSNMLDLMSIDQLQIFSINNSNSDLINKIGAPIGNSKMTKLHYLDLNREQFINFLNSDHKFVDYNKNSFYIVRNGNFLDIKNLFANINGCPANIGRGGSQKSHALSPLDLRLSSYIMAIFECDYKLISSLNAFNNMGKDRYLSYTNKYSKSYIRSAVINSNYRIKDKNISNRDFTFKPIKITEIPMYNNIHFEDNSLCSDVKCLNNISNYLM
jgi:hypothetical protein